MTAPGIDDGRRGAGLRGAPPSGRTLGPPAGPAVEQPRPVVEPVVGGAGDDLGRDGSEGNGGTPPGARHRRGLGPFGITALVAGALLVGGLGGATSAHQQAQARLDAATRIVLSLEAEGGPPVDASTAPVRGDTLIMVTASLTGEVEGVADVVLEKVRTPFGVFDVYPVIRVSDGGLPWRTLLKGTPDCDPVRRLPADRAIDGQLLAGSVAVVRPRGMLHTVDVPVLVANPATRLTAIADVCAPPPAGALLGDEVTEMTARADGSVSFVVTPPVNAGTDARQNLFSLVRILPQSAAPSFAQLRPVRSDASRTTFAIQDSPWTVTATPRLPLVVTHATRVRLTFAYGCPHSDRGTSDAPLVPFPDDLTAGTLSPGGEVAAPAPGWDDAALRAAATAAAVRACSGRTGG